MTQRTASVETLAALPTALSAIGELVDFADGVPRDLVMVLTARYCRQVADLIERDGEAAEAGALARHGVVLGALLNKTLFDVLDLPQDRAFKITA